MTDEHARLAKGEEWRGMGCVVRIRRTVEFALLTDVGPWKHGVKGWVTGPLHDKVGCISVSDLIEKHYVSTGGYAVMEPRYWSENAQQLRKKFEQFKFNQAKSANRPNPFSPKPSNEAQWRAILNLSTSGPLTRTEINRAYRLKSKTAHPDNGGDPQAFTAIVEARDGLLSAQTAG
jgi:hypothetical protein